MKLVSQHDKSPLAGLRSALNSIGFRTHQEYDELAQTDGLCEARISLRPANNGHALRYYIAVDEEALGGRGPELFNELSLEGYPVTACGAGRGKISFEFDWLQVARYDWQDVCLEIEALFDRVAQSTQPIYRTKKVTGRRRAELIEGVLAVARAA